MIDARHELEKDKDGMNQKELALLSQLLEDAYTDKNSDLAMETISHIKYYLHNRRIETVDYSKEDHAWFDILPGEGGIPLFYFSCLPTFSRSKTAFTTENVKLRLTKSVLCVTIQCEKKLQTTKSGACNPERKDCIPYHELQNSYLYRKAHFACHINGLGRHHCYLLRYARRSRRPLRQRKGR
jgi:hypothetical protein